MQDQAPGDSRGDGWNGSWGPARVRLTDLADDYARLLASQDPVAAEATGLPSRALLPDVGPEALAERSMVERRLHQLVRAVETPRPLTGGHGARSDGPEDDARDSTPGDGDPWRTAPSAVRVLRAHLLERLETSIDLIESADQGAELNILTSPFQGVRPATLGTVAVGSNGAYVPVSAKAAAAALDAATLGSEADETRLLYQPSHDAAGAYPIVLVSYLAARLRYDDARIAAVVKAYLRFAASTRGQDASTKATGCAPITRQMREKINAAIDKIAA